MPYNQQQQLAIAHRGSPLMIQAGAGTGKTTTIIGRVVSLLEEGVPPENICMMTFTNKAANSMLTKIVAKTPQGRRITVGTFHGIALQLLYKTAALTGMPMNYKVFGGYETEKLWRRAIANSVGEEDFKILSAGKLQKPGIYDGLYSRMRSGLYTIEQLYNILPKAKLIDAILGEGALERIFSSYEQLKYENKGLDFNDILTKFYEILDNKTARIYIRRRYTHYFIDEYQDTSKLQAAILHKMLGENPNVTVVGDPNQSIYSFLSANIHNMLDFTREYPTAKIIQLNENYRSTDAILSVTNKILNNKESVHNPLHSGRDGNIRILPIFHTYANERDEAAQITRRIQSWIAKGVKPGEIAILARYARIPYAIERELMRAGIPYVKYGGVAFNDKFHVKKFLALVELSIDKRNYLAWEEILPLAPYIGEELTSRVIKDMKHDALWDWNLCPTTCLGNGKRGQALKQLWDYMAPFAELETCTLTADQLLHIVGDVFKSVYTYYAENIGRNKTLGDEEDASEVPGMPEKDNSTLLEEHLKDIEGFIDYLLSTRSNDLKSILGQFRLDSSELDNAADTEKVVVSTIHSAKGLEWENVYVIGVEDGILPPTPRTYGAGKHLAKEATYMEEEERLFYVAATRAKNELHITTCSSRMGIPMTPSPFITGFFEAPLDEITKGKKYDKLNYPTHKLYIRI